MNKRQELRILEEIESSIDPDFNLFPEYTAYDKNLESLGEGREPRMLYIQSEWQDLVKYVVFENDRYNRYLKVFLPYVEKEEIIYLELLGLLVRIRRLLEAQ